MPATPLTDIAMVQILQGHNPSFVGDFLGRKVKLVEILNIKGQKSKCEKRCVPLGCPWSHTAFFSFLMISFFLTNNPVLSHPIGLDFFPLGKRWRLSIRGRLSIILGRIVLHDYVVVLPVGICEQ